MCHIYYPYFKIEKSTQNKKYNHKLYILLLSLFCDKILIPSRHLLEIENDKFVFSSTNITTAPISKKYNLFKNS